MKTKMSESERAERLEALAVDAVTEGVDARAAAELAELRLALGAGGASLVRELEEAAALIAVGTARDREPMRSSLRHKIQEQAFAHFEGHAVQPGQPAPSTTTGANVVSMSEAAPAARRPRSFGWAAAAVVLLAVGGVATMRSTGAPPSPAASGVPKATLATLAWSAGAREGTLVVEEVGDAWAAASTPGAPPLHLLVEEGAAASGHAVAPDTTAGRWVDLGLLVDHMPAGDVRFSRGRFVSATPLRAPTRFLVGPVDAAGAPIEASVVARGAVASPAPIEPGR